MAGMAPGGASRSEVYRGSGPRLMLPAWVFIGIFGVLPVLLMAVYSFLTKEFRGGVIWEPTLAAYDQFFLD
ncbi:MAG: ABC transporter permease, partial [Maritimibacter sp.]|nr:ABC transporter permease [Maritimibacter sp.]